MKSVIALLLVASSLAAEPVRDGAFVGEFVAGKTSIAPGETIDLALRIQHDKNFHTYWKAPGIVGVGTDIDWVETGGLETGDINWPQPQRIKMGPYWAYGYEEDTFLIVPLSAPADVKTGRNAKLSAKVSFMICPAVLTETETCYPGFVDLEFEIPVTEKPGEKTPWAKPIRAARTTFSSPNTTWDGSARRAGNQISLTLRPRLSAKPVSPLAPYFYSADGTVHSDKPQAVTRHKDGSMTISLTRSEFAPKDSKSLQGILYTETGLPDGSGAKPIEIDIPYATE